MVDNAKEVRKQILDCIGGLAAAVTIIAYLVLCIHSQWAFIDETTMVFKVLLIIRTWAPLVVVGISGWEFVSTKSLLWRIVFYVAVGLIVICMFFPNTWNQFVGLVDSKKQLNM